MGLLRSVTRTAGTVDFAPLSVFAVAITHSPFQVAHQQLHAEA